MATASSVADSVEPVAFREAIGQDRQSIGRPVATASGSLERLGSYVPGDRTQNRPVSMRRFASP